MSDEALAQHIDDRMKNGELAVDPEDPEVRNLAGTVLLAKSALTSPTPPELAEKNSRERVLTQMREGGLPPRELHTDNGEPSGLFAKIRNWFRGKS